jgi:hypothetical protein
MRSAFPYSGVTLEDTILRFMVLGLYGRWLEVVISVADISEGDVETRGEVRLSDCQVVRPSSNEAGR